MELMVGIGNGELMECFACVHSIDMLYRSNRVS